MSRPPRIEPSGDVVARVAFTAMALPEAYEEDAWTGVRWRIRKKTFAHATGNIRNDDLLNLFESCLAEIEKAFALGDYVELRRGAVRSHPRVEP